MNIDPIIAYYLDSKDLKERLGFTLHDVTKLFSDDDLESCHNYIQWTFPLKEPSQFNPTAPLLDKDTIAAFRDLPILRDLIWVALNRMIKFYFINGRGFDKWVTPGNHNFLRITRILKFLRIVGFDGWSDSLMWFIDNQLLNSPERRAIIGEETIKFWKEANETQPD